MARKECVRNCPVRLHGKDKVLGGKEGVPSTPVTEIGEGTMGPECKVRLESVAPMLIRKVVDLPTTWSVILSSDKLMGLSEFGCCQFSAMLRSLRA